MALLQVRQGFVLSASALGSFSLPEIWPGYLYFSKERQSLGLMSPGTSPLRSKVHVRQENSLALGVIQVKADVLWRVNLVFL